MNTVSFSNLSRNLGFYLDKVTKDSEPLIVTRNTDKNVVIIPADEYQNLMENVYLLGNDANRQRLIESKKQLEETQIISIDSVKKTT